MSGRTEGTGEPLIDGRHGLRQGAGEIELEEMVCDHPPLESGSSADVALRGSASGAGVGGGVEVGTSDAAPESHEVEDVEVVDGRGTPGEEGVDLDLSALDAELPEDWAAAGFPGARRLEMVGGIDTELVGSMELPVLQGGPERHEWRNSEVGFVNSGVDCYMIASVQLLGTARGVREALASNADLVDNVAVRALRADFGSGLRGSRGGRSCHTARNHAVGVRVRRRAAGCA